MSQSNTSDGVEAAWEQSSPNLMATATMVTELPRPLPTPTPASQSPPRHCSGRHGSNSNNSSNNSSTNNNNNTSSNNNSGGGRAVAAARRVVVCYRWDPYAGYPLTRDGRRSSYHNSNDSDNNNDDNDDDVGDDHVGSGDNNYSSNNNKSYYSHDTPCNDAATRTPLAPSSSSSSTTAMQLTPMRYAQRQVPPQPTLTHHSHPLPQPQQQQQQQRQLQVREAKQYVAYASSGTHPLAATSPSTSMTSCGVSCTAPSSGTTPMQHAHPQQQQQQQQHDTLPAATSPSVAACTSASRTSLDAPVATTTTNMSATTPAHGDGDAYKRACDDGGAAAAVARRVPWLPSQRYAQQQAQAMHYATAAMPYSNDGGFASSSISIGSGIVDAIALPPPPPPPCVPTLLNIKPFVAVHAACVRWCGVAQAAAYSGCCDGDGALPWQYAARWSPCATPADVGDDVSAWYARALAWWSRVCGVSAAQPPLPAAAVTRAVFAVRRRNGAVAAAMLHSHAGGTVPLQ